MALQLDPVAFLREHWQKQPLCMPKCWTDFQCPLTLRELTELACDDAVTSRIVTGDGDAEPWSLSHGPFTQEDFDQLGDRRWTLLVQEVDRHLPQVAAVLAPFRFIPNWRIDDVMVSFATPEGSVGPHIDNYDVFLLQGSGRRRWSIESQATSHEPAIQHDELSVLSHFAPQREWIVESGDLLYLPPRFAHHGVALEDCLTLSIGFRAPSMRELVLSVLGHASMTLSQGQRFADPDLQLQANPGEIGEAARRQLRGMVRSVMHDDHLLDEWIGRALTEPPRDPLDTALDAGAESPDWRPTLECGGSLNRRAISSLAYITNDDGVTLFVGGESLSLAPTLGDVAALLCGAAPLTRSTLAAHWDDREFVQLIDGLIARGLLSVHTP